MKIEKKHIPRSHGTGKFDTRNIKKLGNGVIFEEGVLIFHPENVEIGDNVYIGHKTILKAYHKNDMIIGECTWIGQCCFFHSAGGIYIGKSVGIGPHTKILTSVHDEKQIETPVIDNELIFNEVVIEDGCDIGIGSIILPGIHIGEGSIIGAGSIVTKDIPEYSVWAGNPAKQLRKRL